jgi:hypothetical protein
MEGVSPFEPTVVGAVRREWRLVVAVIVALVIPVGLFAIVKPKTYTATASLTVSDPSGPGVLGTANPAAPDRYVSDQLAVVHSADFGAAAARRGSQQKPPLRKPATWFIAHTSASADAQNSNLLSVSFKAPSASVAMAGVKAAVAAYSDVVRAATAARAEAVGAQLDQAIQSLDTKLQQLGTSSDRLAADKIQQLNAVRGPLVARRDQVAAEAALPDDGIGQTLLPSAASTPGKSAALRLVVLAFAVGLLLGVAIAYVRAYRRRVFTEARDPELVLGAPLLSDLSSIGLDDLLIRPPNKKSSARTEELMEATFGIASTLAAEQLPGFANEGGVSLAIVDAENDASCSAVAWRLALSYAAHDLRVMLIAADGAWSPPADWIARAADRYEWIENADGTAALSDWCSFASGRSLPSKGRNNGSSLAPLPISFCEEPPVRSQRAMVALFNALEHDYDIVLVNAATFMSSATAASMTSAAGRALAVVRSEAEVPAHEELARRLRLAAAVTIGYVYCGGEAKVAEHFPRPNFEELHPPGSGERSGDAFRSQRALPGRGRVSRALRSDS